MSRPLRTLLLLGLTAAALVAPAPLHAGPKDVVVRLESGGEFEGRITAADEEGFTLRRTAGGEFRLLWKDLDAASWVTAKHSLTDAKDGAALLSLARYAGEHDLRNPAEELLRAALRADAGLAGESADVRERIAELIGGEANALVEKAKEHLDHENWLHALGRYRDALELAPEHAVATNGVGEAYYHLRRLGDAREFIEKAIALDPTNKDAVFNEAYLDLIELDFEGCLAGLERVLKLPPEEGKAATIEEYRKKLKEATDKPASPSEAFEKYADQVLVQASQLQPVIAGVVKGPGWEKTFVVESDHYRVQTDISQDYAQLMADRLELIYKEYERQYSYRKTGERKTRGKNLRFPVLVFKDRKDYVQWFTNVLRNPMMAKQTGGVYVSAIKHLVFFKNKSFDDTQLVAWHEAFHQYLDYFIERAPHWFNEGQGEYFGASRLRKSKKSVNVGQSNPWRLGSVQQMLKRGRLPLAQDLMTRDAVTFMGGKPTDPRYGGKSPNTPQENYAASWALIHFCIEGQRKRYAKRLLGYFRELSDGATHKDAFDKAWAKVKWDSFNTAYRKHCTWLVARAIAEKNGSELPDMPR